MKNKIMLFGILLTSLSFIGCNSKEKRELEIQNLMNTEIERIESLSNKYIEDEQNYSNIYIERNKKISEYINAVYKKGDSGEEISKLQNLLIKFKYPIKVNGIFDDNMEKSIIEFQYKNGLAGDGIIGQATKDALKQEPTEKTKYTPPRTDLENMNDAEKFINSSDNYSKTDYYIYVDSSTHLVSIFKGSNKNWKIEKQFLSTLGASGTPTIKGKYEVGSKGLSFGQEKGYTCKYWTQIKGNYLFHSVLYDVKGNYIIDGRLGIDASHGCIRLEVDNAKWIYDNIPKGTTVYLK